MRNPFRRKPAKSRAKAVTASPGALEAMRVSFNPFVRLGGTNQQITVAYERGLSASYGWLYSTQPAVRSVVDYVARNLSQLPLQLYQQVTDTETDRAYDHPACITMEEPDPGTPQDSWIHRLASDFLVFDNAYAVKFPGPDNTRILKRIPPDRVTIAGGFFDPIGYRVWRDDGSFLAVPRAGMIHWHGYNPADPLLGLSKLETLREQLAADATLQRSISEMAKVGFRNGYIKRPVESPDWSREAMQRFREEWEAQKASGLTPLLEEGMEFEQQSISPEDAQVLETRRFSVEEVARLFGVPLSVLGLSTADPAEGRRAFYADVLPPYTKILASQLDVDLVEAEYGDEDLYFVFDMGEKLRGDLESRYSQLTSSTGAPWMTRNEAREKEDLPPLPDGDGLVTPMNVIVDGQGPPSPALPAPNVMPPQDPTGPPQDGSHREGQPAPGATAALPFPGAKAVPGAVPPENRVPQLIERRRVDMARQRRHASALQQIIYDEFKRQQRAVEGKADGSAYDVERFTREMQAAIGPNLRGMVDQEANIYVARHGGLEFDDRQVRHYMDAMIAGTASGLIAATQKDVEAMGAKDALERAANQRAAVAGAQIVARATYFARTEGTKQAPYPQTRQQAWVADTDRHGDLDGTQVPLEADWGGITPGSEPNCSCGVDIV